MFVSCSEISRSAIVKHAQLIDGLMHGRAQLELSGLILYQGERILRILRIKIHESETSA